MNATPHQLAGWKRVALCAAWVVGCCLPSWGASPPPDPFLASSVYAPAPAGSGVELASATALVDVGPTEGYTSAFTPEASQDVLLAGYGPGAYSSPYGWTWHVLPDGVIYKSYMAGPREPRIGTQFQSNSGSFERSVTTWDATVGGRRSLLRFGTNDPLRPEGWEVGLEGAALVRLNLDENRDVDSSDFRFGVPLTYQQGAWGFKTGYYHLSSHLGDEFIFRNMAPTRSNYVRDCVLLGASYNPTPELRLYGETAVAVFTAGGAEDFEFQFGFEYAACGPTGVWGTPFLASNLHLHEEIDYSGDWTTQLGWLWRGESGSTFRAGLHYMNGHSTQYQFINHTEEQVGVGLWYDF